MYIYTLTEYTYNKNYVLFWSNIHYVCTHLKLVTFKFKALFFSDVHLPNLFCEGHEICLNLYKLHVIEQVLPSLIPICSLTQFLSYTKIIFALSFKHSHVNWCIIFDILRISKIPPAKANLLPLLYIILYFIIDGSIS